MSKLIYPELSYQIVGILYSVYNKLHFGYQEKIYQRAIQKELESYGLSYKKELLSKIRYDGKIIGRYFLDFFIEDKIVLEVKVTNQFYQKDIN